MPAGTRGSSVTLKKWFVVAVGVGLGAGVSFAVASYAWDWWESRPTPPYTTSVTAQFEGPVTDTLDDGSTVLRFRYKLTNNSDQDIYIFGSDVGGPADSTMYVQRDDGSLFELYGPTRPPLEGIDIPAGESMVYFVSPLIGYLADEGCSVETVADPDKEQLLAYVEKCYDGINGFVLRAINSGGRKMRIDLSFRPSSVTPRS